MNALRSNNKSKCLHLITKYPLLITRWFGVFPVSGVASNSGDNLRFIIKSPYTICCIGSIIGQFLIAFLSTIYYFSDETNLRTFYKVVICCNGFISTFLTLNLARRWPNVIEEAAAVEKYLPNFRVKVVVTACKVTTSVAFLLAMVVNSLGLTFYLKLAMYCYEESSIIVSFYKDKMPWAKYLTASNTPWKLLMLELIHSQGLLLAVFVDVFIVVTSIYLIAYFEEFNNIMEVHKNFNSSAWGSLRLYYTKMIKLVKIIDDAVSPFILCSFGSNLILICLLLFKILRKHLAHNLKNCPTELYDDILGSSERIAYITSLLVFYIARLLLTSLFAAKINSAARASITTLHEVPKNCYTDEVHRFCEQILTSKVALSGLNFFYVTRKMILTMIATIVTYELVLLQFSEKFAN